MTSKLRVPCAYQGGKQRIADQIVDRLLHASIGANSSFYDLCCGSGAISIELINRGIRSSQIIMLDISSWGSFWHAIGSDCFNMDIFEHYLTELPHNKKEIKEYLKELAGRPIVKNEAELYPILQSCSFGGKQIWRNGDAWQSPFFRDYWEPTAASVRRSPANPMQPSSVELRSRVKAIAKKMVGVTCHHSDIEVILETPLPHNAVAYIDPPYCQTTGYGFSFDLQKFIEKFKKLNPTIPLFVSEASPLNSSAELLNLNGANGGISGLRKSKHQEWLSLF